MIGERYKLNLNSKRKLLNSVFEYAAVVGEFGKESRAAMMFGMNIDFTVPQSWTNK
jgi:hypothetical protein